MDVRGFYFRELAFQLRCASLMVAHKPTLTPPAVLGQSNNGHAKAHLVQFPVPVPVSRAEDGVHSTTGRDVVLPSMSAELRRVRDTGGADRHAVRLSVGGVRARISLPRRPG